MKVSSPVGNLPFEPTRAMFRGNRLIIEGRMGGWPATIVMTGNDIPPFLRVFRTPLLIAAAIIIVLVTFLSTV